MNKNTQNSFIKDIKLKTQNIFSHFISDDEVKNFSKEEKNNNDKKTKINFVEKYLKGKVVKIIVENTQNNKIEDIFMAYCQFENYTLIFSPEKNNDNENSKLDFLLNPDNLNNDFTIPGNGIDKMWHITPLS